MCTQNFASSPNFEADILKVALTLQRQEKTVDSVSVQARWCFRFQASAMRMRPLSWGRGGGWIDFRAPISGQAGGDCLCFPPPRMSKYEVLGVSRSAPLQEIKGAYQAAALATHPDKQAGLATEVLKQQVCVSASGVSAAGPLEVPARVSVHHWSQPWREHVPNHL